MYDERIRYTASRLTDYHGLTSEMLASAGRDGLENVVRILAVHVGFYQRRHGQVPLGVTLSSLLDEHPSQDALEDMVEGLEMLSAVLTLATDFAEHPPSER